MNYKVNKVIYMLLGIILGFFIGGGIIWWQLSRDGGFPGIAGENSLQGEDSSYEQLSMKNDKKPQTKKNFDRYQDTVAVETGEITLEDFIALYKDEYPDSVLVEMYNVQFGDENQGTDIRVARDEMIYAADYKIRGFVAPDKRQADADSLVHEGGNPVAKASLRVEFWRSPLNYKGYKMDEKKLVLFGIYEYTGVTLAAHHGRIYLFHAGSYYPLLMTEQYLNLNPVKDRELIKELDGK